MRYALACCALTVVLAPHAARAAIFGPETPVLTAVVAYPGPVPAVAPIVLKRDWTARFNTGDYTLEVRPQAGLDSAGRLAEAGARFEVGGRFGNRVGDALGVEDGRAQYGRRGRWYMFGAYKGRALGLSLAQTGGALRGEGLTSERGGFDYIQAGAGWRQGGLQASLGYSYTRMKFRVLGGHRIDRAEKLGLTMSLRR